MLKTKYKWTLRLSLLTPILLLISVMIIGGGHGYFEPAICLFPWATISVIWLSILTLPYVIVGLFQFPVYGFLIDKAYNKKRMTLLILLTHLILTIIILKFRNPNWT